MTGLRHGFAGPDPLRDDATRALRPSPPPPDEGSRQTRHSAANRTGLVELHESMATLLAARSQWRQAYHHLRSALDLLSTQDTPKVPEQLRHEVNRLRREHAEAKEQSLRDSLTASYNRRYLDERLCNLLAEGNAPGSGLAVALVDLDWFKKVNDTYGHLLGDRVLQRVVELLQEALPTDAFCARYGGEEFVLVLPSIDSATAVAVCETARARIERFPWAQMAPGLHVTVSMGLAHHCASGPNSAPEAAEQQLLSADVLLYAAKQSGRNAVAYRASNKVRLAGLAGHRRSVQASYLNDY
jgi:two-component system, cell cycle response regulator